MGLNEIAVRALRSVRLDLGLTQAEVAEHMRVGRAALSMLECGDRKITLDRLASWIKALALASGESEKVVLERWACAAGQGVVLIPYLAPVAAVNASFTTTSIGATTVMTTTWAESS